VLLAAATGAVAYFAWNGRSKPPTPGDSTYEQYVEAFELGTAALDVGVWDLAEQQLDRAIGLVPREPAGWANRGLVYLRTQRLPEAARDLAEAEKLAPDDPNVQKLLGLLDEQKGRFTEAAGRFRRAAETNPEDVEALYHLATAVERADPLNSDKEYQEAMEPRAGRRAPGPRSTRRNRRWAVPPPRPTTPRTRCGTP
jgi:tetratricopeptide (TPR) repeat protein